MEKNDLTMWTPSVELQNKLNSLPEEIKEAIKDKAYEKTLWEHIASTTVPLEAIENRKGGKAGELEYVEEFYVTGELDRLFPGWWMSGMKTEYIPSINLFLTTGYGHVTYLLPSGVEKTRQIYAAAADRVYAQNDDPNSPSNPHHVPAGSVTRWIKLFAKRLNIGLEIYHQKISPELRQKFENMIRDWKFPYAENAKKIVETIETGQAFRKFLLSLPTETQTARFIQALALASTHSQKFKDDMDKFWEQFVKLSNANKASTEQTENFLKELEELAIKLQKKSQEKQGTTN